MKRRVLAVFLAAMMAVTNVTSVLASDSGAFSDGGAQAASGFSGEGEFGDGNVNEGVLDILTDSMENLITDGTAGSYVQEAEETLEDTTEGDSSQTSENDLQTEEYYAGNPFEEETESAGTYASVAEGDFLYEEINGSYAAITGYTGTETEIAIPETIGVYTVQRIGNNAFKGSAVKSVSIPNTVESIGDAAFNKCESLENVTFAGEVQEIGYAAFEGCTALKSFSFPAGLETIKDQAFAGCTGLTEVMLPDTVGYLGYRAFAGCTELAKINYPMSLASTGGDVYFNDAKLTSIVIPEGVISIADLAYEKMVSLKEVSLPSTLRLIGYKAFSGCTGLTELTLPDGLGTIEDEAFIGCTGLTELKLPDSVAKIGYRALAECSSLAEVIYPKALTKTESRIFQNCKALKSIVVPEGVTALPGAVFQDAVYLQNVTLPGTLETIGNSSFGGCTGLTGIVLPEGLKQIDDYAFVNCTGLLSLELPDSLTEIGYQAFAGCTGLTAVNYPLSLKTASAGIFKNCSALTVITVPEGVTELPNSVFEDAAYFRSVSLPSTLQKIGDSAFKGCTGIRKMVLPDSVTSIGRDSFYNCSSLERFQMSAGVNAIPYQAFYGCAALKDIWLGGNVTSIDDSAFASCDPSVLVVHGKTDTYVQTWAAEKGFAFSAEELEQTDATLKGTVSDGEKGIGGAVVTIYDVSRLQKLAEVISDENGQWSFAEAEKGDSYRISFSHSDYQFQPAQTDIVAETETTVDTEGTRIYEELPETDAAEFTWQVTSGDMAEVTGYTGEGTEVSIPEKLDGYRVVKIGDGLFRKNKTLTRVRVPQTVKEIGTEAFYGCTSLKAVQFVGSVKSIGYRSFYGCTALGDFSFPAGLETIGVQAFGGCTGLTEITLPDTVTNLGYQAFRDCTGLVKINYPMSLESTGSDVYFNDTKLTAIVIPEGVTAVADSAYEDMVSLKEVTFPSTLREIRSEAFAGCTGLSGLVLPDGVSTIGYRAFSGCTGLTELTLPDGLGTIEDEAFSGCTGLTKLKLPDSVTKLGYRALAECSSLAEVNYPKALTETGSGIFRNCKALKSLVVPEGVTALPGAVFQDAVYLQNVTLPGTLETIGNSSFGGCTGLMEIVLPEGLKQIDGYAFVNCTGLLSLELPDSVEEIGYQAFSGCTGLTAANYPLSLKTASAGIFKNCSALTVITVPEGVTELPNSVFEDAAYLRSVSLPSTLQKIGDYAFKGCTGIRKMILPDSVTSIGRNSFYNCSSLERFQMSAGVNAIPYRAFYGCTALKDIWLGENVTSIDDSAFVSCDPSVLVVHGKTDTYVQTWAAEKSFSFSTEVLGQTDATLKGTVSDGEKGIGGTVVTVYDVSRLQKLAEVISDENGQWSFAEAEKGDTYRISFSHSDYQFLPAQTDVVAETETTVDTVGTRIYEELPETDAAEFTWQVTSGDMVEVTGYTGEGTEVSIPEKLDGYRVVKIGDRLFRENKTLTRVRVPQTVKEIGTEAFYGCTSLKTVQFAGSVKSIGDRTFYGCTALENFTFPAGLETIEDQAFGGCTGLTEITLPDTVTYLGYRAFRDCTKLAKINYPMSLESTGSDVYLNDAKLTSIVIPEGVTAVADSAYEEMVSLKEVTFPSTLQEIGNEAFAGCTGLSGLVLPDGVSTIGYRAFSGCTGLTELTLPDGLEAIDDEVFSGCTGLTKLKLPDSVAKIGYRAFAECTGLAEVNYPKALTKTGSGIFRNCIALKSLVVPEGVTALSDSVFADAEYLQSVTLPGTLEIIGYNSFGGCTGLTGIVLPEGLKQIDDHAFVNCTGLQSLELPDSVEEIGYQAFSGCTGMIAVNYPLSLKTAGAGIFQNCSALKNLTVPEGVTELPETVFEDAAYLRSVSLPSTLQKIGNYAFKGCTGMPEITLPEGLEEIGENAFEDCDGLVTLMIPGSVKNVRYGAFRSNGNLKTVVINDGVSAIESDAFRYNTALRDVYIPNSVTSFGTYIFDGCENVLIHCQQNSAAAVYAINNNLDLEFYDDSADTSDYALDMEVSGYELSTENALANGYMKGTVRYKVKDGESLSGMSISLRFPSNTQLIEGTIKRDQEVLTDLSFKDGILTIPVTETQGKITFCLKPETNKRYDSFAQFHYRKEGTECTDTIGVVSKEIPTLTVNADEIISTDRISISGVAPILSEVSISVNGEYRETVCSLKNGKYQATLTLDNPQNGDFYNVEVSVKSQTEETYTASAEVWYIEDDPKLVKFDMFYNNHQDAKLDLLDDRVQGSAVAFNPSYPFRFVVGFENGQNVDNVVIQSDKNGVIKTLSAEYDPVTNTYVAFGYFGGISNYVPGSLSVVYNSGKAETELTPDKLTQINNQVYRREIENSQTSIVDTAEDGTVSYVTKFNDPQDSFFESEELKTAVKIYDQMKDSDWNALHDICDMYHTYLDVKSDKYFITVIDNFKKDPETGTSGLLILVGDTLDNKVTEYFLEYGGGFSEAALRNTAMIGQAIKTAGKIAGTYVDTASMRRAVMSGNYSEAERTKLLREIDLYEKTCVTYNILACAGALAIATGGVGAPVAIAYYLITYMADQYFDDWKFRLQSGQTLFGWIVDPSGYVYEAVISNRLKGVKATVYYLDKESGGAVLWDAQNYSQSNPLYTDSDGVYAWDVPEGQWRVQYEMAGYESLTSDWYPVPPAQTEINVGLVSTEQPELEAVNVYETYTEVFFSQYVNPENLGSIILTGADSQPLSYELEYTDAGVDADGETLVRACRLNYPEGTVENKEQCTVALPEMISYAGKTLPEETIAETVQRERTIRVQEQAVVGNLGSVTIRGTIENFAGDEVIQCEVDTTSVAEITQLTQPDSQGAFEITLKGLLPGETKVNLSIEGTGAFAQLGLTVQSDSGAEHTHDWKLTEEQASTCVEAGFQKYQCGICGEGKTESLDKTSHTYDGGVITKQATCKETGIKTYTCTACGSTRTEAVPKTDNHSYEWHVEKPATCGVAGSQYEQCRVCLKRGASRAIAPTGRHTFGAWTTVKEPTALATGTKERTCTVCTKKEQSSVQKLAPVLKLTAGSLVMKTKQSTSAFKVTEMTKGDYLKSVTSSKTSVLKVSGVKPNGTFKLKAQKKTGKAKLTIELASGLKKTITVKVQKSSVKTTGISGVEKKLTLKRGRSMQLYPVIAPVTSQDKVKYTTSNKKVVTVSSKGKLKAKKKGSAVITVTCGKVKVKCKVKVK